MIGVTLFGLIFTPIFYVLVRNLSEGRAHAQAAKPLLDQEPEGPPEGAVV